MFKFLLTASLFAVITPCFAQTTEDFHQNYLGSYVVSEVRENDGLRKQTLCVPFMDEEGQAQAADPRCGQKVWVFKNEAGDQVAMFSVPADGLENQDGKFYNFSIFRSALFSQNRKCTTSIDVNEVPEIFHSGLCRAFKVNAAFKFSPSDPSKNIDRYMYFPNMEPKAGQLDDSESSAVARAIVSGLTIGLPIGMSSVYFIDVPKDTGGLSEITIHEIVKGVVFGVKDTFKNELILPPSH
jgi:hypothetical protein